MCVWRNAIDYDGHLMGLDKHGYIFIVAIVPENTTKHMLLQTPITV